MRRLLRRVLRAPLRIACWWVGEHDWRDRHPYSFATSDCARCAAVRSIFDHPNWGGTMNGSQEEQMARAEAAADDRLVLRPTPPAADDRFVLRPIPPLRVLGTEVLPERHAVIDRRHPSGSDLTVAVCPDPVCAEIVRRGLEAFVAGIEEA